MSNETEILDFKFEDNPTLEQTKKSVKRGPGPKMKSLENRFYMTSIAKKKNNDRNRYQVG